MINNNYKELLRAFIEYKLKDEPVLGFGGNENGEYVCLTLDEFNTESMLTLKFYANQKMFFENEYWDDDDKPIRQIVELDSDDLEMIPEKLVLMMKAHLAKELIKYNDH